MQTEASESSPKAHQSDGCRVVSADPVPDYLSIRYEGSRWENRCHNIDITHNVYIMTSGVTAESMLMSLMLINSISKTNDAVIPAWPEEALQQPQQNFCLCDLAYSSRVLSNYCHYHHEWWTFASPPDVNTESRHHLLFVPLAVSVHPLKTSF